jgi:hypothetical protein
MANKVLRFIPEFLKDNQISDDIYAVEKSEIDKFHTELKKVFNNNFISTLDLKGIKKYEEMLDIVPQFNDIETRRNNILNRMNYRPPITRQKFLSILEGVWGTGNYTFEIQYDNYTVIVDIYTTNPEIYWSFQEQVRRLVPANMILIFSLQYTHLYLHRNYNYGAVGDNRMDLTTLSYGELSRYAQGA